MKKILSHLEEFRIRHPAFPPGDDDGGAFVVRFGNAKLRVLATNGHGWDHVSVSLATRCPAWQEMCKVKELFFEAEEAVMQLHPPASEYVNFHPFCLHLWRPQTEDETLLPAGAIPLPPFYLVGPKS